MHIHSKLRFKEALCFFPKQLRYQMCAGLEPVDVGLLIEGNTKLTD